MGVFELPQGYVEIRKIDLVEDKKAAFLVNMGAFGTLPLLFFIGLIFNPLSIVDSLNNFLNLFLNLSVLLVMWLAIVLYIIAHEFVHGVFIKKYSGKKAKYGFTGVYAFAGSDAYFNKRQYIVISLAPVVLWGVIFFLLNIFLPVGWFWPVYLIQMMNISGAAGDIYVTRQVCKLPADLLIKDAGVSMIMYSRMT